MKQAFLVFIILFSSAVSFSQGDSKVDKPKSEIFTDKKIEAVPLLSDETLAQRIRSVLIASELIKDPIVTSNQGVITISGVVEDTTKSKTIEKLAANTEGVITVLNKLQVKKTELLDLTPAKSEAESLAQSFIANIPYILGSLIVLGIFIVMAFGASRVGRQAAQKRLKNSLIIELVSKLFALPFIILGIYLVLRISGLTGIAVTLLGGTGALGLIVGLAMKNIIENYFSGIMLSVRNPYRQGDSVIVAGFDGVVQKLTTRGTTLIDSDGNHIMIPNNIILANTIVNKTASSLTREKVFIELNTCVNPDTVIQNLCQMLGTIPELINDPAPYVLVDAVLPGSVRFGIYFWINNKTSSGSKVKSLVITKVKNKIDELNIPFPQQETVVYYSSAKNSSQNNATEKISVDTSADHKQTLDIANTGRKIDDGKDLLK